MFRLTAVDIAFIGLLLESFFYGLYSGIFVMYLQFEVSKKDTNSRTQNIIFFSICVLYVLSIAVFVGDLTDIIFELLGKQLESILPIYIFQSTSFGCCDIIAQFILIYRCWIVWGRNIRVVIIPSILAFAFFVIWIVVDSSPFIVSDIIVTPHWAYLMTLLALALSLTVNALVTGLIVFRICKVLRGVKSTSDNKTFAATGGSKLRQTIMILIESGMTLFSIQLARLVVTIVWTDAALTASPIIIAIHQMLNGITPTIIVVRISMGLSFHDEKSMEEVAIESLCFAPKSIPETGSISIVAIGSQDNRDGDDDIQQSIDIDSVVER